MKKPMRIYKPDISPVKKWEFKQVRGRDVYAENGHIKTYANRAQAYNKVELLRGTGLSVGVTASHPFLIVKVEP